LARKKRGHGIDAGQERGEDPEKGDEAAEEDDLAAMLHEEILTDLDARLGQADVAAIANEHREAGLPPDPIADIVSNDGAGRSRGNDLGNIEAARLAGINGRGSKYRLARQRQAHAFQANHPATANEPYFMSRVAGPSIGFLFIVNCGS
jgi:hypothetical protein